MTRRSLIATALALALVVGIGAVPTVARSAANPAAATPAAANPVAAMAWFGTGNGPRGLVMLQQQDTALAVRGLLVGLPASTTARIRLHAGTCAALGARVLTVRAASNGRGSAEPKAVLTRTAGTLPLARRR